jgi:ankyrin repeat protein
MKVSGLVQGFLVYLQNHYAQLGAGRYDPSWITQQATDFQSAVLYSEQSAPALWSAAMNGEQFAEFLKNIHKHCAKTTYQIRQSITHGASLSAEHVGVFRTSESFSMKHVPLFDMHNAKDKAFLRAGKMPRFLDGRLQLMGHNPQLMSQRDKERAMHGQPVWLEANSVFQIATYIDTNHGKQAMYYFLCGYYRENFVTTTRVLTDKDRMFAQFMETEINTLAVHLGLVFNKTSRTLDSEETLAMDRVYITYVSPEKIQVQFAEYAHDIVQQMRQLDVNNILDMANFCIDAFQRYIRIHPFLDANYRTLTIFLNAFLSQAGYEYINFHDTDIKSALNTHFGRSGPDRNEILHILNAKLVKTSKEQLPVCGNSIFNYEDPGKAIRNATAHGRQEELLALLNTYPDMMNAIDQNPNKGWTALHWAVYKNQLPCIKSLLELDARYDIKDKTMQGWTAVDICLSKLEGRVNELFIDHLHQKYMKDSTLNLDKMLRTVSNIGDLDAVKFLIAMGADINSFGPETGQTALHRASQKKNIAVVSLLVEHGADLSIVDKQGKRAIDYVTEDNHSLLAHFRESTQLGI